MAEVENVLNNDGQSEPQNSSVIAKIGGGIKEWFRKLIVKLKRRPMNIAFFVLAISSVIYLCLLGNFSQAGLEYSESGVPISVFINTLFSILVLLLFMYSFPKRAKKPNIVMLIFTFAFMAVMIALDILLYVKWGNAWNEQRVLLNETQLAVREKYIYGAINGVLVHMIFLALSVLLTATYPLYGKLINKINTRKVVESTQIKEAIIDTNED